MIVLPGTREIWSIGLPAPGRTALEGVTSLSRKCSSLQQEVRVFRVFRFADYELSSRTQVITQHYCTVQ
jgi:hypothetical protein